MILHKVELASSIFSANTVKYIKFPNLGANDFCTSAHTYT